MTSPTTYVSVKSAGRKFYAAWLALAAGLIAAAFGLNRYAQDQSIPQKGSLAPDFELTLYTGENVRLSDYRGKIVLINFWASWCGSCRTESPELEMLWQQYGAEKIVILGVAWMDTDSGALTFIDDYGLTYPIGPDTSEQIAQRYRVRSAPETYIIDQSGKLAETIRGPISIPQIEAILDTLLTERM